MATEHPEAVDAIAAALRAHIDRRSAGERDILQALLLLLSEDTGLEGARQLGALGDPRAVAPLVHAMQTRETPIAVAAAVALANYDEALEPLARCLLDDDLSIEVRSAAAAALGELGTIDAGDVLLTTLRRRNIPIALREAMAATVDAKYPGRSEEFGGQVSEDGSFWLAAGAASGLGYTLYASGSVGQAQLGGLGGASGALAGGSVGYLAGRAWPIEAGDAAFISTNGMTGIAAGHLLGMGFGGPENRRATITGGLIGEVVGFGAGAALYPLHKGNGADAIEALAVGGVASVTVASFAADRLDRPQKDGRVPIGGAVGLVVGETVGHLVAPHVRLSKNDGAMIALSAAYGAAVGTLAPLGPRRARGPLPLAGAGTGALLAWGLSGPVDIQADVVAGSLGGMAVGGTLGYGIGRMADPGAQRTQAETGAFVGATLGLTAGGILAWRNPNPPEASDAVAVGVATAWAGWQAVGWGYVDDPDSEPDGLAIALPAAVAGVGALATPLLDIPAPSALAAGSLGVWGGYVGGVTAQLSGQPVLPYALVGSDIGLGIGAISMSPFVNTPPLVVGMADAGGVLGGSLFALGASFATDDTEVIVGASLAGAGVGFTGGVLLGQSLRGKTRDIAFLPALHVPGTWSFAPAAFPVGETTAYGAQISVTQW